MRLNQETVPSLYLIRKDSLPFYVLCSNDVSDGWAGIAGTGLFKQGMVLNERAIVKSWLFVAQREDFGLKQGVFYCEMVFCINYLGDSSYF